MPTKRRPIFRGHATGPLTCAGLMDLTLGTGDGFATEDERRVAWEFHRAELMDRKHRNPGSMPAAWWAYESPEPRNEAEPEPEQLRRLGVLDAAEQAATDARLRHWESTCRLRAAFAARSPAAAFGQYEGECRHYAVPMRLRTWKRAADSAPDILAARIEAEALLSGSTKSKMGAA